jgi:hypothetical protein
MLCVWKGWINAQWRSTRLRLAERPTLPGPIGSPQLADTRGMPLRNQLLCWSPLVCPQSAIEIGVI